MAKLKMRASGEGDAFWFLDTLMVVRLPAAETNGSFTIFEQTLPPGSATPMHRHDLSDEHFHVLEGELDFHNEAGARRCGAGALISVPRGTVHAFRVASRSPARLIVISTTPHFEQFVRAVSAPAPDPVLPPPGPPPPEAIAELAAIGARHDVTIVGPPPGG